MEKPTFVDIITKVDEDLFDRAILEIQKIDWDFIHKIDTRHKHAPFATSTAMYFRIPINAPVVEYNSDSNVRQVSEILDAEDTDFMTQFSAIADIINWANAYVAGKKIGRVMLVKLAEYGKIPLHIDPGKYFDTYKRFHVVFKSTPGVVFLGPPGTVPTHMPVMHLCQLNNIDYHGVESKSNEPRIHLIIDIETDDPRFSVTGPQIPLVNKI